MAGAGVCADEADIKLGPEDAAKPDLTRRMLNNGEPYTRVSGPLTEDRWGLPARPLAGVFC